jgi:ribokinase
MGSVMGSVIVAGSINMDVVASAARFPKPGETIAGERVQFFPGGKGANQAVAAARSGAATTLIGRLGSDAFAHELKDFLAAQGVDLAQVRVTPDVATGVAVITVSEAENTIVVIPGANGRVTPQDVESVTIREGDVLVSQFEIPAPAIAAFFERGRRAGARTILNPAPMIALEKSVLDLVDILVLNETELGVFGGVEVGNFDEIPALLKIARGVRRSADQVICLTLGKRGVVALVGTDVIEIAGHAVTAVDTTGAGDCFVGAIAARLAAGASIQHALEYANRAASICVQRHGAGPSMPTLAEVSKVSPTRAE